MWKQNYTLIRNSLKIYSHLPILKWRVLRCINHNPDLNWITYLEKLTQKYTRTPSFLLRMIYLAPFYKCIIHDIQNSISYIYIGRQNLDTITYSEIKDFSDHLIRKNIFLFTLFQSNCNLLSCSHFSPICLPSNSYNRVVCLVCREDDFIVILCYIYNTPKE